MDKINDISKESLSRIRFCHEEVLPDNNNQIERFKKLTKATFLGDGQRKKVSIIFKNVNGKLNLLETTVCAVSQTFVCIKTGVSIPINSIVKVAF